MKLPMVMMKNHDPKSTGKLKEAFLLFDGRSREFQADDLRRAVNADGKEAVPDPAGDEDGMTVDVLQAGDHVIMWNLADQVSQWPASRKADLPSMRMA